MAIAQGRGEKGSSAGVVDEASCAAVLATEVPACGTDGGLPEGEAAGVLPWDISRLLSACVQLGLSSELSVDREAW